MAVALMSCLDAAANLTAASARPAQILCDRPSITVKARFRLFTSGQTTDRLVLQGSERAGKK